MSISKDTEEGFSQIIPNGTGIPGKKECSNDIRKEHNRWKKEVRQIKEDKSIKGQSYWQVVSSCASL